MIAAAAFFLVVRHAQVFAYGTHPDHVENQLCRPQVTISKKELLDV